jgi:predicted DNA-binding transcriptional regulator AlpA
MERLLTSQQLADLLQVTTRTLDAWAYRGVGPRPIRIGKHRRYSPADVAAWLQAQKDPPNGEVKGPVRRPGLESLSAGQRRSGSRAG